MAGKGINIQDTFLNQARREDIPVTFHLINGFQIKGLVKSFDNFTIVVDSMGKQQMLYKHAISTITPARMINLMPESENTEGEKTDETAAENEVAPEKEEPAPEKKVEEKPKKVVKKVVKKVSV